MVHCKKNKVNTTEILSKYENLDDLVATTKDFLMNIKDENIGQTCPCRNIIDL